jgi:hypothetical protein
MEIYNMKTLVADFLSKASNSATMQKLLDGSLVKAADFYRRHRMPSMEPAETAKYEALFEQLSKELTVRSGPFTGMKYPGAEAAGSALIPKLLGSYEKELHGELERLIAKGYDDVIDVGCAEGYYATGMAMRLPGARVHAYDTSETARELCSAMVALNGVRDRVAVQTTCTPQTLIDFPKAGRTLIIVDCESYEKVLFTPAVRDALKGCDVLIETHDFLDVSISTELEALFAATHRITHLLSVDDIQKAKHYFYEELEGLPVPVRFQLLREGRPMIMEWLILEPV